MRGHFLGVEIGLPKIAEQIRMLRLSDNLTFRTMVNLQVNSVQ